MKRWAVLIIAIVAVIAMVAWRMTQKQSQAAELASSAKQRATGPVSVSEAIAGPRTIEKTLDAVGSITAPYNVKLSPKISGLIDYLQVREGDPVKAGQVIVRLNPDTTTATVLQNAANVAVARQRYAQAKLTQNPTNVGVSTAIGQQIDAVNTARANLTQVSENLNARIAAAQAAVTDGNAKIAQARAALASAGATLASSQATLKNAQTKLNRELELYRQNYVAAQDVDDQRTAADVAAAGVNVSQKGVDAAEQAVRSTIATRDAAQNQLDITKRQADADVKVAKSVLESSLQSLRLARSNSAQSPAYQANLDALMATVRAAEGTLAASKVLANDINLASPIDGTVTARTLDPGSIAQPGTAILTIEFLKWVFFNATIPVEQSSNVFVGQKSIVTLDSLPGRTFTGKIVQLNPSADPTSHQFLVLVKLDNPQTVLRPGMYGHLGLVVQSSKAAVALPREAVTVNPDGTGSVIRIDKNDVAHKVDVKLGAQDANGFEILDGLQAGDKVVSLSYAPLRDGQKVKVTAQSATRAGGFGVDELDTNNPTTDGDKTGDVKRQPAGSSGK